MSTSLSGIKPLSALYADGELRVAPEARYKPDAAINERVSLIVGDITKLEVEMIVNAANTSLLGGGGVDGAIHSAAGPELLKACRKLGGCDTGDVKVTDAFKLPSRRIAHTPGPVYSKSKADESARLLASSYSKSLRLLAEEGGGSIAFPCISAGVYGYPAEDQAHVALRTVREALEDKKNDSITRVIFCQFGKPMYNTYAKIIPEYFPKA